jgi:enoyl-CoA hydratase/carnithine racemase
VTVVVGWRDEAVAVVTIDRQEALDALNVETLTELRDRLRELAEDDAARVVVLTGAGERAFVAGADIKYMGGLDASQAKAWGALGHEAARLLEEMPKPTIAAINGFALGGGCELALGCDLVVADETARFGLPETAVGLVPGPGLVRGRAHRALHHLGVARLRMIGIVPVREEGEVGEVHHARAAHAQVREEAGLAQGEGAALQAGGAAAGGGGHAEHGDLAGGHAGSIINPLPAALSRAH